MDKTTVKRLSCITLIIMGFGGLLLAVSEFAGDFCRISQYALSALQILSA